MKTLSIYRAEYGSVFFEGNKLIRYIHENDADWRDEYFNPVMLAMGIKVKRLDKLNKVENNAQHD